MTAKAHRLSIGIGIVYLLSQFHDIWRKTELALIFLSCNLLRASVYPQCIGEIMRYVYTIQAEYLSSKLHLLLNEILASNTKNLYFPFAHCALRIVHCALCIAHCPLRIAHCPLPIAHCALCIVYCTLRIVHCELCIVHCSFCIVHYTFCILHCALCIVYAFYFQHSALSIVHFVLCILYCALFF